MGIDIRVGTVAELTGATELLDSHNSELAVFGMQALNPDVAMYAQCEAAGMFFVMLAFAGEKLVGYSGTFIHPHPHYAHVMFASNNLLYVIPRMRGTLTAFRLMRATVDGARKRGAKLMSWSAKPGSTLDNMLRRMECRAEETLYVQEIAP